MSTASHQEIDRLILSFAGADWQKVAKVSRECERRAIDRSMDAIADRIRAMVKQGKLQAQGNLSKRRYSEVKLLG